MRVSVHWNFHRNLFSVVAQEGEDRGRVIAHVKDCTLRDATFRVQPAGRERVRAEGRKNVHARVFGELAALGAIEEVRGRGVESCTVTYNPYEDKHFMGKRTFRDTPLNPRPLEAADRVRFSVCQGSPRVLARRPKFI